MPGCSLPMCGWERQENLKTAKDEQVWFDIAIQFGITQLQPFSQKVFDICNLSSHRAACQYTSG